MATQTRKSPDKGNPIRKTPKTQPRQGNPENSSNGLCYICWVVRPYESRQPRLRNPVKSKVYVFRNQLPFFLLLARNGGIAFNSCPFSICLRLLSMPFWAG